MLQMQFWDIFSSSIELACFALFPVKYWMDERISHKVKNFLPPCPYPEFFELGIFLIFWYIFMYPYFIPRDFTGICKLYTPLCQL